MNSAWWKRLLLCLMALTIALMGGLALAEGDGDENVPTVIFSIENDGDVERGDFVVLDVSETTGAKRYNAAVHAYASEEEILVDGGNPAAATLSSRPGYLAIPTALLPAGQYDMVVTVTLDDDTTISSTKSFTVTDHAQQGDVLLNITREGLDHVKYDVVPNCTGIWLSLYAPGAEELFINYNGEVYSNLVSDGESGYAWNELYNVGDSVTFQGIARYADGSYGYSDVKTVSIDSSSGNPGEISVDMADVVTADNATGTVSVTLSDDFVMPESCTIAINMWDNNTDDFVWSTTFDKATGDYTFTIDEDVLTPGHSYRMYAYIFAAGYDYVEDEHMFVVTGEASDRVKVQVDGHSDTVSALKNDNLTVEISAPGATAVQFFNGDWEELLNEWGEWEDWSASEDEYNISFDWSHYRTTAVYALACFDDDPWSDDATWYTSNVVAVIYNVPYHIDPPTISVPESVTRGDVLTIAITNYDEHAEWGWANISSLYGEELVHTDFSNQASTVYLPTASLSAGVYQLYVGVDGHGVNMNVDGARTTFTVTEPEDELGDFVITLNPDVIMPNSEFTVSAWADGADHVQINIQNKDNGDIVAEFDGRDGDTSIVICNWAIGVHGNYTVIANAHYSDDTDEGYWREQTLDFTATAIGALDAPYVSVPATVLADEAFDIVIEGVDNAQFYTVAIGTPMNDWNDQYWNEEIYGSTTLTIDPRELGMFDGGYYRVTVYAEAVGYDEALTEVWFMVVPAGDSDHTVTLSINGEDDQLTLKSGETAGIVVYADDADQVEIFNGWDNWDDLERRASTDYRWVRNWSTEGENGEIQTIYARARYGDDTYVYSNPVHVTMSNDGWVGDGAEGDLFTLQSDTVVRGDALNVTIQSLENVVKYHLRIRDVEDNELLFVMLPNAGEIALPTDTLEPGSYRVEVGTETKIGYTGWGESRDFTVTESDIELPRVIFTTTTTTGVTGDQIGLMVYAPGASEIRVYDRLDADVEEWWNKSDWENFTDSYGLELGTHYLIAAAWIDDEWVYSDSIAVTATELGTLPAPQAHVMPSIAQPGQTVVLYLDSEVDNAENYSFWIKRNEFDQGDWVYGGNLAGVGEIAFPAELFIENCSYTVWVDATAVGYGTGTIGIDFIVVNTADHVNNQASLYVAGANDDVEVSANVDYLARMELIPGTTGAALYCNGYWDYRVTDSMAAEPVETWNMATDHASQQTCIGRFTTDDFDPDNDNWPNEVTWEYTNQVNVTVAASNLPVAELSVNTPVTRPDFIRVKLDNLSDFDQVEGLYVSVHPYRVTDGYEIGWRDSMVGDTVILSSGEFPAGEYIVDVTIQGAGYNTDSYRMLMTIEDASEHGDISLSVDGSSFLTGQTVPINAYAPGADRIHVMCTAISDGRNDTWFDGENMGENFYLYGWSAYTAATIRVDAEAYHDGEDEPYATASSTFEFTAPYGNLNEVTLDVLPAYNRDENVVIGIYPDERAENVWYWITDRHGNQLYWGQGHGGENTINNWEIENYELSQVYTLHVMTNAVGYNQADGEAMFAAMENVPQNDGIGLTINGQSGYLSMPTVSGRESLEWDVTIDDMTGFDHMDFYNGQDWEWITNDVPGGHYHRIWNSFDYPTTKALQARVWYTDGSCRYSDVVIVEVWSDSEPEQPALTLSATELTRGDVLTATISEVDDISWYAIDIWNDDGYSEMFRFETAGSHGIPTIQLEPGDYGISTHAHGAADGSNWSNNEGTEQQITILQADVSNTIYAYMNGTVLSADELNTFNVAAYEDVNLIVYAPGAEQIKVYYAGDDDFEDTWEWDSRDGDYYQVNHWRGNNEYMRLTISVCYDGEWTEPAYRTIVDIQDGRQRLEQPNLTVSADTITVGDDIAVTLDGVDGATSYFLHVYMDGQDDIYQSYVQPGELGVPGWVFAEPGFYWVHVDVSGRSYSNEQSRVALYAGNAESTYDLNMSINGSFDGEHTVLVNENIAVTVDTDNENVTGIALFNGDGWNYEAGNQLSRDGWGWGHVHTRTMFALATEDDFDPNAENWWDNVTWSHASGFKTLNFISYGTLPTVQAHLVSDTVSRGESLIAIIDNYDEFDNCAFDAHLDYETVWGTGKGQWRQAEIYITTADIEPGEYHLYLGGRKTGWLSDDIELTFTVTEPAGSMFTVSPTELVTTDRYSVNVYVPDANGIRLYKGNDLWGETPFESDNLVDSWMVNEPETFTLRYSSHTGDDWEDDAGWSELSEGITVTATAPYGHLPVPEFNAPTSVQPGDSAIVYWNIEGDFDWAYIDVHDRTTNEYKWSDQVSTGDVTIEPSQVNFEAGHMYSISLNIYRKGYTYTRVEMYMPCIDNGDRDDGITLTINGENEMATVLVFDMANIVVNAPEEATAVRLYMGNESFGVTSGNMLEREVTDGMIWETVFYARYTTDPEAADANWDEVDWDSFNWSGTSNYVTLKITANGYMPDPQYEPIQDTYKIGEIIAINLTDWVQDGDYGVNTINLATGEWVHYDNWDGEGHIYISTADKPAGDYNLRITAGTSGLIYTEVFVPVTLVEPDEGEIVLSVAKHEIITQEQTRISVYAPGADSVTLQVLRDGNEEDPYWDESGETFIETYLNCGGAGTFDIIATATYADGTTRTANDTVTITAPYGDVWDFGIDVVTPVVTTNDILAFNILGGNSDWWFIDIPGTDFHEDGEGDREFSIETADLGLEPGNYEIHMYAAAKGKQEQNINATILVVEGSSGDIQFSISKTDLMVGEEYTLTINAPGAKGVRFLAPDDYDLVEHGDSWEATWTEWSPGDVKVYAMYTMDDLEDNPYDNHEWHNWVMYPDPITLHVTGLGQVGEFTATAPATVTRGELLPVTFTASEHANTYHLRIRNVLDNGEPDYGTEYDCGNWGTYEEVFAAGTAYLRTIDLSVGETYIVTIWARGDLGYSTRDAWTGTFTVQDTTGVVFALESSSALINEDVDFSLYAPGAFHVNLYDRDSDWQWYTYDLGQNVGDDGALRDSFSAPDTVGIHRIYAKVYSESGDLMATSSDVTLTTTSLGQLAEVNATIYSALFVGESYNFRFDGVDNAWDYHVSIDRNVGDGNTENLQYTEGVQPGGFYWDSTRMPAGEYYITIIAIGDVGYENSSISRTVTIVERDGLVTFTLPAALGIIEEEAFCGTTADMIVIPYGVTSIGSRAFADCPNLKFIEITSSVTSIADDAFEGSSVTFINYDGGYPAEYAASHNIYTMMGAN